MLYSRGLVQGVGHISSGTLVALELWFMDTCPRAGLLLVFSLHTFAKHLLFVKCVVCVIEVK